MKEFWPWFANLPRLHRILIFAIIGTLLLAVAFMACLSIFKPARSKNSNIKRSGATTIEQPIKPVQRQSIEEEQRAINTAIEFTEKPELAPEVGEMETLPWTTTCSLRTGDDTFRVDIQTGKVCTATLLH